MSAGETTAGAQFGQLMRRCRRAAGLSQEELGARAGLAVRTIGDLERGQRSRPYRQTVGALAEALGLGGPQLDEFVRLSRPALAGLPEVAVPASVPVPRELPAAVAGFTGRDSELAALDALLVTPLADTPLTMLITAIGGTAGVGKTALAVQWAHRAAGSFPDGQLYVNLRGYDPGQPLSAGEALTALLRTLGVPGRDIPPGEDERAARYRSLLAGRRMLIVLDNACDAGQVRPLLPGTPGSVAMVTSRDALTGLVARDGARRLDLDVLPLSDAVGLLRTLIGGRVDAEPAAAAGLAAHCCRLPLAVRVAAELAVARPGASLASLATELAEHQRLDLLDAGGDPSTAVRAVFSWSLRHLNSAAVRAFRLVGVHPGPDLEARAAAALTGTSPEQARRLLDQLTRAHLIQRTSPGRYAMHDLLSEYAGELAAVDRDGEQRAALTRLLDYYLHAAAAAMDALYPAERGQRPEPPADTADVRWLMEPGAARAWLAAELPCLVAAVVHAAAQGWPEHAIRLAATTFRYLDPSGHLAEAVLVHESARSAARRSGDVAAQATALSNLATAELRQGRDQDAALHLRQALSLSRQTGDRTCEARALGNLGVLAFWQGRYGQATDYYERARRLHREMGNRAGEVTGLCNLAGVQIRLSRYEQAASYLQQALDLSRDIGNQDGEAYALLNLGDVSLRQGRDDLAVPFLRQSLALSRHLGDRVGEAAALCHLGEFDLRQGRYQHAARQLQVALTLSREAGARSSETDALHLLGEVSLTTGDHRQARNHHAGALALASQAGDIGLQARAHDGLARTCEAEGDPHLVRYHWQQALTRYAQLGAPEADQVRSRLDELLARTPAHGGA